MKEMVRVKSTSKEGIRYLVNGWNRHKAFWIDDGCDERCLFKDKRSAKTSLSKLLKSMPDYRDDIFDVQTVHIMGSFIFISAEDI